MFTSLVYDKGPEKHMDEEKLAAVLRAYVTDKPLTLTEKIPIEGKNLEESWTVLLKHSTTIRFVSWQII